MGSTRKVSGLRAVVGIVACAVALAAAPPATADGFAVHDQGAKAMALGGAFTAQADDGSAMFYNLGALALMPKGATQAGVIGQGLGEAQFQGISPGIAAGGTGELESGVEIPAAHAYLVKPLRPRLAIGLGVDAPFYLANQWADPDTFPGRSIATDTQIRALDTTAAASVRLGQGFGFGAGVVVRASEVSLDQRLQRTEPASGQVVDVASYALSSDTEIGIGFRAGLLHQVSHYFAYGLSYRSGISIDHAGSALLTQIPSGNDQFDELLAASLPFDQELALATTLDYPAAASVGVAVALGQSLLLEVDAGMTEWSQVQALAFDLPNNPDLDRTFALDLDDTMNARVGLLMQRPGGTQLRAGFAYEEGAQPPNTIGPVLFDTDSTTLALGFGKDWLDVAISWTQYDDLSIATNLDGFNGRYSRNVFRLGITVGKKGKVKVPGAPKTPELPKLP